MALASIEDGELMQKKPSWWLGSRTKLEYTTAFDGELHVDDFEEVADEVRRTLGEIVTVNAVGRTMTINTSMSVGRNAQGRAFQLHLTLRHGRTNVRVYEDLTNVATQWFAGLGIGAGSAIFALVGAAVGTTTHSPELVIAALVPAMGSVWATCRYFYRRTVRKRDAQIREILRRVVLRAKRVMQA